VAVNNPPVLTLSATAVAPTADQPILLSSIVSYSDAEGDPMAKFAFDDFGPNGKIETTEAAIWLDGKPLLVGDDVFLNPDEFARAVIMPVTTQHRIVMNATDGANGGLHFSNLFPTLDIEPSGSAVPTPTPAPTPAPAPTPDPAAGGATGGAGSAAGASSCSTKSVSASIVG